jgi:TonB family protein
MVETIVSSHGTPRNTRVLRGLDKDIDEAVVAAVKQWLFAPGRKDGKAVAVRVQIEIEFHSM